MDTDIDPFFGPHTPSVNLPSAPLIRVLAQVRFPPILKIAEEAFIADFQEAIRKNYPRPQRDVVQGVDLIMTGNQEIQHRTHQATVWRFFDRHNAARISLAPDFISLETARYDTRKAFLDRLRSVLDALASSIEPSGSTRVGFRYVSRLQGDALISDLPHLVKPNLLNALCTGASNAVQLSMTDVQAKTEEGTLVARLGLMPANQTHDPDMAPVVPERSWIMDIDASAQPNHDQFDPEALTATLQTCAGRAYTFFRWSVTDAFLQQFGGQGDAS